MPFEHACFISYRRGQGELVRRFINELRKALEDYLEPYLNEKVFLDERDIGPGDFYHQVLSSSLCRSICLIVVYTPRYFEKDHSYCAREYRAMELLEEARLATLVGNNPPRNGLIIPIVFRGPDELPDRIKRLRQYYDFSKYTLVQPEIGNNSDYVAQINEIARRIYDWSKRLKSIRPDPCQDCDNQVLPTDLEISGWLEEICGGRMPVMPFPGREGVR